MAALLNPTVRRLAPRCLPPAAAEPLVPHWRSQGSRRYYMIGGKGGVGKTGMAASLALKFANCGEPTLLVSTVPHSLGDSFEQDVSGGKILPVSGVDSLFATEIGHKKVPFYHLSWIRDFVSRANLGAVVDPYALNEMLHKAPAVFSELTAIGQLIKSVEEENNNFRRIVLDTAATAHTLKLLHGTNWLEKSLGLAIKTVNATSPDVESTIGKEKLNLAITKLEEQKQLVGRATKLFHDPQSMEFIIVTIPTVMAVNESSRFHASLKEDGVLVRRLIVNQVLPPSESDCRFFSSKQKEETRVLNMISNDSELGGLKLIKAPLLDVELRGVPALKFLGDAVWK